MELLHHPSLISCPRLFYGSCLQQSFKRAHNGDEIVGLNTLNLCIFIHKSIGH